MENYKIAPLKLNGLGYLEFTFEGVRYYLLEGVLTLSGKAQGFSSELDTHMYFISKEMPNKRLKNGLAYAMKNYLEQDYTFKNYEKI